MASGVRLRPGPRLAATSLAIALLLLAAGAVWPRTERNLSTASSSPPQAFASRAMKLLQESRATADPALLSQAERLLDRSLAAAPRTFAALVGMASLANARHQFADSVTWSRRAIAVNRYNGSPYGLLGDALYELGRYRASERAYQTMVDIRPDYASYIRVSYARQSRGDVAGAIAAARLAIRAAPANGETAAWLRHQLGDVYFGSGRLRAAARQNRIGMRLAPGYVPPRVGVAEVAIARGQLLRATRIMEHASERLPSLEYLITLGDLYSAQGLTDESVTQDAIVARRLDLYRAHGVQSDVDFILFYADRGIDLERATAGARTMYRERPTNAVADALAWVLHARGRDRAAARYIDHALAGPTYDAVIGYHAGMITAALDHDAAARGHLARSLRQGYNLTPLQRIEATRTLRTVD